MTKQQASPQYLPAINRQLEHQAGLLRPVAPRMVRPAPMTPNELTPSRPWLGADFTHTIEAR